MEQTNNMTIGKKIMSLRKEAGLTQEQLAEKLGISPQAVSKWENGISCPDISMLPVLASLFRVTVDDLLGVERIEPEKPNVAEAINTNEGECDGGYQGCCEDEHHHKGRWHGIGFALLLIGLGVAYLVSRRFGFSPNLWSIVWPAVVLGLGVSWFVKQLAPLGLGVAFVGFYYLMHNIGRPLNFVLSWDLIWPVALVLLGLGIIIDISRWGGHWRDRWDKWRHGKEAIEYSEESGYLKARAMFAEANHRIKGEKFIGGKVHYTFAGGELNFFNVRDFSEDGSATLDVHFVFAGCELLLPPHIRVDNRINAVFGGVELKSGSQNPTLTLVLTGDVVFAGMEIRYIA